MDELVYVGYSNSFFGIKGEIKVISDFERLDNAFKVGNKIIINNIEHTISSVRYHKNYILITIDEIYDINKIQDYIGYNIYIKRIDLNLGTDEYLYTDLIGVTVIDDNKEELGTVIGVEKGNGYDLIRIKNSLEFLIPLIDIYIDYLDIKNKILYTKNARSLIL